MTIIRRGNIKRIHINQHNIRANAKSDGEILPVITCKTSAENHKTNRLNVVDSEGEVMLTVIYSPDKPLSCGAKVWIETKAEVIYE